MNLDIFSAPRKGTLCNGRPVRFLSLNRTDHDAFDEILLYKRIGQNDGAGRHDRHRHFDAFGGHGIGRGHNFAAVGQILLGRQNVVQIQLERELVGVREIQHALVPVVPVLQRQKQPDGCDAGTRERKDDSGEDLPVACRVDLGGFNHFMGDGFHEISHQQHVEGRQQRHENHGPEAVLEVEVHHHQHIGGNHARGKQGGEIDEERNVVAVAKVVAVEHIACHGDQNQPQRGAHKGDEDGHAVCLQDIRGIAEKVGIGIGGKDGRQDAVPVLNDGRVIRKGCGNNDDEGNQTCQRYHQHDAQGRCGHRRTALNGFFFHC